MHASCVIRAGSGRSDVHRARGAGPLRLLCPRAAGNAAWVVTSSLGGGLVDGDHVALDVTVDAGATCVITSQASTKAYKGRTSQRTTMRVGARGCALLVPDPIVPYRDAHFTQVTQLALAPDATLIYCDVLTAGRVAYGERWAATHVDLALSIAGLLHDRILLARDAAARMGRFDAIATAILLGPRVADLAAAQLASLANEPGIVIAGSPLGDGAVFRIAGERVDRVVHRVRALLGDACARVGEDPWSRKW